VRVLNKKVVKATGQKLPPEASQTPVALVMRMNALEEGMQRLAEVHQQNLGFIQRGFALVDGHQWVLKRMMKDIVQGTVKLIDKELEGLGGPEVDEAHYYEIYRQHLEEQQKLAEERLEAETKAAEEAAQQEAEPETPDEPFGGDVANASP